MNNSLLTLSTFVQSYSFNPVAGLTEEQKKLVLGGQHLLWTEQAGPSNLDSIVWPRAASAAEVRPTYLHSEPRV
jgi:hexosaminidase